MKDKVDQTITGWLIGSLSLSPLVPEEEEDTSKSADEQFENGDKLDGKESWII